MPSVSEVAATLDRWSTQIQDFRTVENKRIVTDEMLILLHLQSNQPQASPEEIQAVLRYWSSAYTNNQSGLAQLLHNDIEAQGVPSQRGCALANKDDILSHIRRTTNTLKGVNTLILKIYREGAFVKVKYFHGLEFKEKDSAQNRAYKGSQRWCITRNGHGIQFSTLLFTQKVCG